LDIRYMAGFFDGEGHLGIACRWSWSPPCFFPIASVVNTDRPILEEFRDKFGGSIRVHEKPYGNRALSWTWCLHKADGLRAFLEHIGPHLRQKGAAAQVLLWALDKCPEEREEAVDIIHRLNQRGPLANKDHARRLASQLVHS